MLKVIFVMHDWPEPGGRARAESELGIRAPARALGSLGHQIRTSRVLSESNCALVSLGDGCIRAVVSIRGVEAGEELALWEV